MGMLRISLFGTMNLWKDEEAIALAPTGRNLLAYLLLYSSRQHPREVLTGLFWGEYNEQKARNCLNTALWRIRKVLEPAHSERGAFITTTNEGAVSFNRESEHWLDVAYFERTAARQLSKPVESLSAIDIAALEEALGLYTADLLEGQYDDWVLRERERLRRLHLNCLAHLMFYHQHQGAIQLGIRYGRRILELDPLREEIHRTMMRLYVDNGQRAQAIRQYERCRQILLDELGMPPMPETRALCAQIIRDSQLGEGERNQPDGQASVEEVRKQLRLAERELRQAQIRLTHATKLVDRLSDSS